MKTTTFSPTTEFFSSHKMGNAKVSESRLLEILGPGEGVGDKSENSWSGNMTTKDGEEVNVSCWDWKGGMRIGYGVSIWCSEPRYLQEWKELLEN